MAIRSVYGVADWKAFKVHFGLKTSDLSLLIGLSEQSIRNATSASYVRRHGMPTWAVSAIFTWKKAVESDISREADLKDKLKQLIDG